MRRAASAPRATTAIVGALIGLLVGVVALGLALKDVNLDALTAAFGRAGVGPLLLGSVFHVAVMAIYGLRWRVLLDHPVGMPVPRTAGIVGLGYLANYTLPGRPGELVRAGLARGLGGVPVVLGLSSLFLEKVLDGVTILASALILLALRPTDWLGRSALVGAAVFAVGALVLVVAVLLPRSLVPAAVHGQLEHAAAPIRLLASRRVLGPVVAFGAAIWLTIVLHQAVLSLGAGVPFEPAAWLLLYAALGLASVVPGAPGYVGTYQLAAVLSLGLFGVAPEVAIVVATYYQLSRLIGALVVGSWAVSREGLAAVKRAAKV